MIWDENITKFDETIKRFQKILKNNETLIKELKKDSKKLFHIDKTLFMENRNVRKVAIEQNTYYKEIINFIILLKRCYEESNGVFNDFYNILQLKLEKLYNFEDYISSLGSANKFIKSMDIIFQS